jgi:hypothetical protein
MDSVKNYFKDYPGKEKCFTTTDGLVFHEKGDANMHAATLTDKEVEEHNAAKHASAKKSVETKPLTAAQKKAAEKEAAEKEAAGGDDATA